MDTSFVFSPMDVPNSSSAEPSSIPAPASTQVTDLTPYQANPPPQTPSIAVPLATPPDQLALLVDTLKGDIASEFKNMSDALHDNLAALTGAVTATLTALTPKSPAAPVLVSETPHSNKAKRKYPTAPQKNKGMKNVLFFGDEEVNSCGLPSALPRQQQVIYSRPSNSTGRDTLVVLSSGHTQNNTILVEEFPAKFKMPQLDNYKVEIDLEEHLHSFGDTIIAYSLSDALKCKLFLTTLKGAA